MYGDQFGEFVCGYWGLKGQSHNYTRQLQMLATALQIVAEQINGTFLSVRQKMMGMLLNVVHCQVQKIV